MKKICSLASVISGHQFRTGVSDDPTGDSKVLQIKDLSSLKSSCLGKPPRATSEGRSDIDWSKLDRVDGRKVKKDCFAQKDDILFAYRGESNAFFHLKIEPPRLIIPNYFLIIRVHYPSLDPEFLYWYLQQKPARRQIERMRLGTSVSMISREGLLEVQVPLPPLEKQKQIAEFSALTEREFELLNRINIRKYELREQMLIDNTITTGV